jgi:hypothetical protein
MDRIITTRVFLIEKKSEINLKNNTDNKEKIIEQEVFFGSKLSEIFHVQD